LIEPVEEEIWTDALELETERGRRTRSLMEELEVVKRPTEANASLQNWVPVFMLPSHPGEFRVVVKPGNYSRNETNLIIAASGKR
jgi:hypothetical protein